MGIMGESVAGKGMTSAKALIRGRPKATGKVIGWSELRGEEHGVGGKIR